jgi:predicted nucleotidyltransferase
MVLEQLLQINYPAFIELCKSHKVNKIYAFGSSITERFDNTRSDIDLIVSLDIQDPLQYGETLISLWDKLESFFKRKVDLLTEESISNPYLRKSIEATKKLIYDGQGEQIFI